MKKVLFVLAAIMAVSVLNAGTFSVMDTLFIPGWASSGPNNGGIGNFVTNVDCDGDGLMDLYMVNHNWNDTPGEIVPRLYKFEKTADGWVKVWEKTAPADIVEAQNSYNPLSVEDVDGDGKMEIWWGIPNNIQTNANPARILVYEQGTGDDMGVEISGESWPNAYWTITDADNANIRPVSWKFADIDNDGTKEILMAGRTDGPRILVASVDNIPDNGDESETWTTEYSDVLGENKWDVAVMGGNAYFFDETEIAKISWDGSAYTRTSLSPMPGGISWDAVQVADVDGDGTEEMFTGEYRYGDATRQIYIFQEDGDTLKRTPLVNLNTPDLLNGGRMLGGAQGDIDADGKIDFVFGSYLSGPPNGMIFRFEYQGGAITDPNSWELTVIDSAYKVYDYPTDGGCWNRIQIANIDDDMGQEVAYTSMWNVSVTIDGNAGNMSAPIIFLDSPNTDPMTAIRSVDNTVAAGYRLSQNFPNPFNPTTTISFAIPTRENVTLRVFDLNGKLISTLMNTLTDAGEHSIVWNGTNAAGERVASGVYIYRMETPTQKLARTMNYLK